MNKSKIMLMMVAAGLSTVGLCSVNHINHLTNHNNQNIVLLTKNNGNNVVEGNNNSNSNNNSNNNLNNSKKSNSVKNDGNNIIKDNNNISNSNNSNNSNSNNSNSNSNNSNANNSNSGNINKNNNQNNGNQTLTQEQAKNLQNKTVTVHGMKFSGLQAVKIAPDMSNTEAFAATPGFNPNGFASNVNEQLYNYELNPANDQAAMTEATELHDGNPIDTCVFFQSSALRAIGQDVPDYIGYTTHLENWLSNNGWSRHTNFQYLQKGDICFASYYHTFLFMGWENKAEGIAYVMGNESFTEPYYRNRNLNGQSSVTYGNNSYYQATCYWTYGQGYTGAVEGTNPVHPGGYNSIGTATTTTGLNLRTAPNTSSSILSQVSNGVTVPVIAQSNGWFKVYYNGNVGWIDGNYTEGLDESLGNGAAPTNMPQGDNLTVTSPVGLWLTNGPSSNSGNIVLLPNGTPVKALAFDNGWYKVDYEGTVGWLDAQYTSSNGSDILPNNQSNNTPAVNNTPTNNTPSFTTHSVNGTVTVLSNGLWINSNPYANDGNLVIAPKGTELQTTEESSNGWYKVSYNGQTGWIGGTPYSSFTAAGTASNNNQQTPNNNNQNGGQTASTGTATVNSPIGLWLLGSPSMSGSQIEVMPYNADLKVIGQSGNWTEVEYNGETGWCYSEYINVTNNNSQSAPTVVNNNPTTNNNQNSGQATSTGTATVNSSIGLWLLGSPSMSGSQIEVMPYNADLKVIGQSGNWTKVEYNGQTGWCYSEYINVTNNNSQSTPTVVNNNPTINNNQNGGQATSTGTATVNSPIGLWLLGSPSMSGSQIEVMPYNADLKVIGQSGNWTEVEYNGQTGWCYSEYINVNNNSSQRTAGTTTETTTVISPIGLWLNASPSMSGNRIEVMPYGAELNVIGQNGKWTEVEYNGQTGWCYTEYTSMD